MSKFIVTYNNDFPGVKLEILGTKPTPYLCRFNNILGGRKSYIWGNEMTPNHWSSLGRGFFTNWNIEIFAWDRGLHLVWEEYFKLAGHMAFIEITPDSTPEEVVDYLEVIHMFSEHNGCFSIVNSPIQTSEILKFNSGNVKIVSGNEEKGKCYAYYKVGKNLEEQTWPTDTFETERTIWSLTHIRDYKKLNLSSKEIAKDILFGLSPYHPKYATEYVKLNGEKFFNLQYQ